MAKVKAMAGIAAFVAFVVYVIMATGPQAHAGTNPYQWIKTDKPQVNDVVFHNTPEGWKFEADGDYVDHLTVRPSSNGRAVWLKLTHMRIDDSTKLTTNTLLLWGCNRTQRECTQDDGHTKAISMHRSATRPGWYRASFSKASGYHIAAITVDFQLWFRMTCGTNC